jgi:hypothetical protein
MLPLYCTFPILFRDAPVSRRTDNTHSTRTPVSGSTTVESPTHEHSDLDLCTGTMLYKLRYEARRIILSTQKRINLHHLPETGEILWELSVTISYYQHVTTKVARSQCIM